MNRPLLAALVVASVVAGSVAAADADASVVARFPENGTTTETTVLSADGVASADAARERHGRWGVTVELTDDGAQSFTDALVDAGFTSDRGVSNCPAGDAERNDEGYCLLTVLDGDVVSAAAVAPSLADAIASSEFADDPRLRLTAATEADATRLARAFGAPANATTTATGTTSDASGDGTATSDSTEAATTAGDGTGTGVPGFDAVTALLAAGLAAVGALSRR